MKTGDALVGTLAVALLIIWLSPAVFFGLIAAFIVYSICRGIYKHQYQLWTGREPGQAEAQAALEEAIKLAKY